MDQKVVGSYPPSAKFVLLFSWCPRLGNHPRGGKRRKVPKYPPTLSLRRIALSLSLSLSLRVLHTVSHPHSPNTTKTHQRPDHVSRAPDTRTAACFQDRCTCPRRGVQGCPLPLTLHLVQSNPCRVTSVRKLPVGIPPLLTLLTCALTRSAVFP